MSKVRLLTRWTYNFERLDFFKVSIITRLFLESFPFNCVIFEMFEFYRRISFRFRPLLSVENFSSHLIVAFIAGRSKIRVSSRSIKISRSG